MKTKEEDEKRTGIQCGQKNVPIKFSVPVEDIYSQMGDSFFEIELYSAPK